MYHSSIYTIYYLLNNNCFLFLRTKQLPYAFFVLNNYLLLLTDRDELWFGQDIFPSFCLGDKKDLLAVMIGISDLQKKIKKISQFVQT